MEELKLAGILKILEGISHIRDIDTLLEQVLYEARRIVNAEAGSIFLLKGEYLSFEYVQNDILHKNLDHGTEYLYSKKQIRVDNKSIAGYAALTKNSLIIDDVYNIPEDKPYSFNRKFDELSNYTTQSVLTVPLINNREKVIGVFQIINPKDDNGRIVPFNEEDVFLAELFAKQAAIAIENAIMTREIILRMISIAELRDPQETGTHVNRVGAYSVEIYKEWAREQNIPETVIKYNKGILRIAAMLHDVGKVAISDAILKKKDRLTVAEYEEMKLHTIFGARLFKNSGSEWDDMARDIIMNHHERWDGTGYPGHVNDVSDDHLHLNPGKKGDEIPVYARIVALADVFDALMSKRWYKDSWPQEKVFELIRLESGKHFDPTVVEAFFRIRDRIINISEKYN